MHPYTQRVEDGQSRCDLSLVRLLHAAGSERGGSARHTCRLSRLPAGGGSSWLPRAACRGGWTGAGGRRLIWRRAEVYLPASALGPGAPRPPCRPLGRQIGGHVGAWGELKVSRRLCFKRTGLVQASGLLSPVGVPCCWAGLCGDGAVLPGGPEAVWQTEVA